MHTLLKILAVLLASISTADAKDPKKVPFHYDTASKTWQQGTQHHYNYLKGQFELSTPGYQYRYNNTVKEYQRGAEDTVPRYNYYNQTWAPRRNTDVLEWNFTEREWQWLETEE